MGMAEAAFLTLALAMATVMALASILFRLKLQLPTESPTPVPEQQHHFDHIGKDPKWGWDEADDAKTQGNKQGTSCSDSRKVFLVVS
jgi:hypothetical protein